MIKMRLNLAENHMHCKKWMYGPLYTSGVNVGYSGKNSRVTIVIRA